MPDRSLLHTLKYVMSTNAPMRGEIVPFRLEPSRELRAARGGGEARREGQRQQQRAAVAAREAAARARVQQRVTAPAAHCGRAGTTRAAASEAAGAARARGRTSR